MPLKEKIDATLDNAFDNLVEDDRGLFVWEAKGVEKHVNGPDITTARLRLDLEVAWKSELPDGAGVEDIEYEFDPIVVGKLCISPDLEDLAINGDVNHSSDPLLKTIDGAKKRGREVDEVNIVSLTWVPELKPRKQTTEFTAFILMQVSFK